MYIYIAYRQSRAVSQLQLLIILHFLISTNPRSASSHPPLFLPVRHRCACLQHQCRRRHRGLLGGGCAHTVSCQLRSARNRLRVDILEQRRTLRGAIWTLCHHTGSNNDHQQRRATHCCRIQ